jgi:hypothetical protein
LGNQQKFNELSATIFSKLYDSFPIGIDLDVKNYPAYDNSESSDLFVATVRFYIDEQFFRCNNQYYGGFSGLVLTSKGYSVLNAQPPEQFASKSSIATALKDAIATGKTALIQTLVSESIKLAIKIGGRLT